MNRRIHLRFKVHQQNSLYLIIQAKTTDQEITSQINRIQN